MKSEKDIYVYGFQVSIYKNDIFTNEYLQISYQNLIYILEKSFELKINQNLIYFGYIFDYSRINEYKKNLDTCKKNNLKYALFNTMNNSFYLDETTITKNINDITIKVFNDQKNNNNNKDIEMKNISKDEINEQKLLYIKNTLTSVLNLNIKKFKFIKITNEIEIDYKENNLYVQFLNNSIFIIILINNKIKMFVLKENNLIEEKISINLKI